MDCPSNLDRLTIKGLRCTAHIGCKEEERALPQALAVNLRLFLDTDCAARTDDLEKTVNYARLSKAVIRHCEESKCMLIETLAQNLATLCLEFSNLIQEVEVEVVKPAGLPNGEYASVTIHRHNVL